ncbi:MAG: flagellar filament capping protein FliD [Actinomycetota bacterium]|nr:flagellar filament capping protein FliD [Actinomycetota bacterium]
MAGIGLSGLASGVDTDGIVTRLMALERQSITRFQKQQRGIQAEQAGLKDVQSKLKALKTAAQDLRSPGLWANKQTIDSTDPARVGVSLTGMAPAGSYSLEVRKLAAAEQEGFTYTKSSVSGSLTVGGKTVTINPDASSADLAASINGNSELSVFATALDDDTIVFSARKPGTANAFDVTSTQLTADPALSRAASDAEYSVDGGGTWNTSSSNVIENLVVGVKATLKGVTSAPVSISVGVAGVDPEAVKEKVKAFITAYNDVVGVTRGKLDEKAPTGANLSESTKGQLFGDTGLTSMLGQLRRTMSDEVSGLDASMNELLEVGISTGKGSGGASSADARMGKLSLDEAKLTAALSDPAKVRALFSGTGGADGFAQKLEAQIDSQVGPNRTFDERLKVSDARVKRLQQQMTTTEERIVAKEKRLRAQFAAMETALNRSQTQQGWLGAQIASLDR